MKETEVQIPIDGTSLRVHGVLRGGFDQPLLILCPGLGGWMHDLLLFNASRYFEQKGIATLRVSFYGHEESQRDIKDFDVHVGANDLDHVVAYARKQGTKWIGVVGHSYSGLAIVYSEQQDFDAAILWDPTHTDGYEDPETKKSLETDFVYVQEIDSYVTGSGGGDVLSRKVFGDYAPGSRAMAEKFKVPTLVANASWSTKMQEYGKDYADSIAASTENVVIPNSSHPFTEDGAMDTLFKTTHTWIKNKIL